MMDWARVRYSGLDRIVSSLPLILFLPFFILPVPLHNDMSAILVFEDSCITVTVFLTGLT